MSHSTGKRHSLLPLWAVTVLVAAVQLMASQAPWYGYDEAWHLYLSSVSPFWKALEEMAVDPHPPLYYVLLRPLVMIGPEPFWPRLLSVAASVLTVPLWYGVLRKLDLAREVALTLTLVLALSHGFNELGLTVRAYSLAALCLVGALWFWSDFMAVPRAKPSRTSLDAMLALLTMAFWFSYYAVFFSVALVTASLLASLFDERIRTGFATAWRQFFRWPERIAVVGLHALGVAWFLVGYGRAGLAAPPHVSPYLYHGDSQVGQYLLDGLRAYLHLFAPFFHASGILQDLGLLVIGLGLVWLLVQSLRRGAVAHAALLLTIPLVLSILCVAGFVGFYPFGGYLRHQHLLLFLLLLALGIGLGLLYRRLPGRWSRTALCVLIVAGGGLSTGLTHQSDPIGEFPASEPLANALDATFGVGADAMPVYMAVFPFYVVYADRFRVGIDYRGSYGHTENGWVDIAQVEGLIRRLMTRREWDEYVVLHDARLPISLFRDRTLFQFPEVPDAGLFERLHELMEERELKRLRILRAGQVGSGQGEPLELAAAFDRHGFDFSGFQASDEGATWVVARHGQ